MPLNTAEVVTQPDALDATVAKLRALPEVATTWSIQSFVPANQDKNLPTIEAANKALGPTLHSPPQPPPTDEENVAGLTKAAQSLRDIAAQKSGAAADAARRLGTRSTSSRRPMAPSATAPAKRSSGR